MTAVAFIDYCHDFANVASPYIHIADHKHYNEALELVEQLMEEVGESTQSPLNAIINLLAHAIEIYENQDKELLTFERTAMQKSDERAVLRTLMDQYGLGVSDLPEIGDKSAVSRILSGERSLNKNHIKALCERFKVSPNLFF